MSAAPQGAMQAALARLIADKEAERALVDRQLAVLRALPARGGQQGGTAPADVLLMLYLDLRSAKDAAAFCNAQGWRLPGAKGPRLYTPDDVYDAVRCDAAPVDALLLRLARQKLGGSTRPTRFG